jgi:DNA-binding transcriptional LysR family regulator
VELIHHVRALRVLCQVDASGSFTGAASALGLSQSAVSQHVATLERAVGVELVERNVRPVALTAAGHALVVHGRAILARVDTAEQELAELAGRRRSRLRLGTFPTALTTFAPAAIAQFRRAHPGVTLTIVDDHMQRLLPRLRDRELDLALVYEDPALPGPADVETTRVALFDDRYQAVLPRGHRLARRSSPLDLAALADDPWIGGGVDSAWFRIVRDACRRAGFEPEVTVGSDDYHAVLAFAASGLGVAVVPGLAAAMPPPGVVVRPLRGSAPTRRIAAVTPRDAFPQAAAQTMLAVLSKAARGYVAPRQPNAASAIRQRG